jgi:MFS family permease
LSVSFGDNRLVSRNLVVLGLVGFVTSFGAHSVAVNLPTYAKEVGVGTFTIGLLIAVYDFAEVIAKPLFGYLADRRGQVRTLWAGLGLFSVASIMFPLLDPRLLLAIRLLQGLGAAAFSVISVALVAAYFPKSRGEAIGKYNALKGAGYVVAPAIGGIIVAEWSFAALFVVSAAVGFVILGMALTLKEPSQPSEYDDDEKFSLREFLAPFSDPRLMPWYVVIIVNMFFVGILFGFVPVYLSSVGFDPFRAGLILSAGTLTYLAIQPFAGRWADRYGGRTTVLVGLVVSSLCTISLVFTQGLLLVALVVLGGLGIGVVWTNTDTIVSNLAKSGKLSTSLGTAGSFKEIGDMLGPLSIGAISQFFGLVTGFVVCGLMGLLGTGLIVRRGVSEGE